MASIRRSAALVVGVLLLVACGEPPQRPVADPTAPATPPPATAPIWQIGREDGASGEFLPYSSREFSVNRALAALPGYDRAGKTFTYRVGGAPAAGPIPFPAGFSSPCAGTWSTVGRIVIRWHEDQPGWRVLDGRLLDAKLWDFARLSYLTATSVDPDSLDLAQYTLRVRLPDGRVAHQRLPSDLAAWERAHGPWRLRVPFQVVAGENALELADTSGGTYARCWHIDFLRLAAAAGPAPLPPVVELAPAQGFLHRTVYDRAAPAVLAASVYNLPVGAVARLRVAFLDVWDRDVAVQELPLTGAAGNRVDLAVPCPAGVTGHLRARASLTVDGARQPLQGGNGEVELRLAAIRSIAPLDDDEVEASPIGLCGLVNGEALFDPAELGPEQAARYADYRAFRRLLQIRHERLHWLPWCYLEPRPGEYRWEPWDRLLAEEAAEGMRVQLNLMATPAWLAARGDPARARGPLAGWMFSCPPDLGPWEQVCGLVAARYRDRIAGIELWNEPSSQSHYWQGAGADDFARLVERGATAIRAAAPGLPITVQSVWARQAGFVERLHDLGIQRWVDHPADHYMDDARLRLTNAVLDRRQARNQGLLNNECWLADPGGAGEVDQAARLRAARNLVRNAAHAQSQGVVRSYEFELLGRTWRKWGKIGPDGTPRPAFSALKTLVNRLAGTRFVERIELGDAADGYLYAYRNDRRQAENGGSHLLILASRAPATPASLRLPVAGAAAQVVDIMDNARALAAADGELAVELAADPLLIVGVDADRLRLHAACRVGLEVVHGEEGRRLLATAALAPGAVATAATVAIASPALDRPVVLTTPGSVQAPLRDGLADGVYPVTLDLALNGPAGPAHLTQRRDLVVAARPLGADLLPAGALLPGTRAWTAWGPGTTTWGDGVDGQPGVARAWDAAATGGLTLAAPVRVIPGQRYLLAAQARGAGTLLLMRRDRHADGREEDRHALRRLDLGDDWRTLAFDWTAPAGVQATTLAFYQHASPGRFTLAEVRLLRIDGGTPVNRWLFTAPARGEAVAPAWTAIPAAGRRLRGWSGEDDCSARFAFAWQADRLHLRVQVRDDRRVAAAAVDRLWAADSVQVAFSPSGSSGGGVAGGDCTQFAIGLVDGRPRLYRHAVSATADLYAGFATGADPVGCEAAITATAEGVLYDIVIATDAILPGLRLAPGAALPVSLLVNDDDGDGRKGWLEWAGGIGDGADVARFGSLRCE